jgi:hypothetical protein
LPSSGFVRWSARISSVGVYVGVIVPSSILSTM